VEEKTFEPGEKFLYYGSLKNFHGYEGVVEEIDFGEYRCRIRGITRWLRPEKMEKVNQEPDWEI
jgi:hypothetical protein